MAIYDTIKAQEVDFPLPQPSETITVGTFNAVSGGFEYAVPVYERAVYTQPTHETGDLPHPERETFRGGEVDAINAFSVKLRFEVTGRQGGLFSVYVSGRAAVHAASDSVEIDVGAASSVSFSLECGGETFYAELPLRIRRLIVGAGAITIPALPITIVYAPPVDQQQKNVASWTGNEITGSTTSVSFHESGTITTPVPFQEFEPWAVLAQELRALSAVLDESKNEYAKILGAVLGTFAGMLGTATVTSGSADIRAGEGALTVTLSDQTTLETVPTGGGPGAADVVFFLKNAKIFWFSSGGPMKLALLGWDAIDALSTSFLLSPSAPTDIDRATREALLALDPFVSGGPAAELHPPRYVYKDTFNTAGVNTTFTVTHTITNTDRSQVARSTMFIKDYTAGFLAFANIGVTETIRAEGVLTQTSTSETTMATTISRQVEFFANPKEYYSVEVYCDVVFGTFAFRSIDSSPIERLAGRLVDLEGLPVPNSEIVLWYHDQRFHSRTDENGEFSFRAGTIGFGEALLVAGETRERVELRGEPTTGLDIRHGSRGSADRPRSS